MVVGSRQSQVISEKGNQNSGFFVWANFFLAKLIQIKYLSLEHMGIVNLTDVGCVYRVIKRDALEKIISKLIIRKLKLLNIIMALLMFRHLGLIILPIRLT